METQTLSDDELSKVTGSVTSTGNNTTTSSIQSKPIGSKLTPRTVEVD